MHICLLLNDDVISWESNNPSDFVAQSCFGFQATIRVFRGFDGLSSISGSKLWQNKQKLIRGIPTNSLGNLYKIRGLSALTWAPETPGS